MSAIIWISLPLGKPILERLHRHQLLRELPDRETWLARGKTLQKTEQPVEYWSLERPEVVIWNVVDTE